VSGVERCERCTRPKRAVDNGETIAELQVDCCISWLPGADGRCAVYAAAYKRGMADLLAIAKEHAEIVGPTCDLHIGWRDVDQIHQERLAAFKEPP
jgi:hypothetical protein